MAPTALWRYNCLSVTTSTSKPATIDPAASTPTAAAEPALTGRGARLGAIAGSHAVVDFFAVLMIPLLPVVEGRVNITQAQGALVLTLGGLASGLVQPLAAWITDRFNTRVIAPLGLLIGAAAIGSLGFVRTYEQLLTVAIIAQLGVGAYHPVGAATIGQLAGSRRSRGMAVFFVMGMVGHWAGNLLGPRIVEAGGLEALVYLIPVAVILVVGLHWAIRSAPHRHESATATAASFTPSERTARWFSIGVLYIGNILRFTVNMMLFTLVIRWAEWRTLIETGAAALTPELRTDASILNGQFQAALVIGMGVGGLGAGWIVRTGREKWPLVAVGLLGAPLIALFPGTTDGLAYVLAVGAGIGYASSVPLTLAMSQRLLPHRTSLASGIVLGGTWVFSAMGPVLAQLTADRFGLAVAFGLAAALLALASLITTLLPSRLVRESALL